MESNRARHSSGPGAEPSEHQAREKSSQPIEARFNQMADGKEGGYDHDRPADLGS